MCNVLLAVSCNKEIEIINSFILGTVTSSVVLNM